MVVLPGVFECKCNEKQFYVRIISPPCLAACLSRHYVRMGRYMVYGQWWFYLGYLNANAMRRSIVYGWGDIPCMPMVLVPGPGTAYAVRSSIVYGWGDLSCMQMVVSGQGTAHALAEFSQP